MIILFYLCSIFTVLSGVYALILMHTESEWHSWYNFFIPIAFFLMAIFIKACIYYQV